VALKALLVPLALKVLLVLLEQPDPLALKAQQVLRVLPDLLARLEQPERRLLYL
jgi:hypothetical protein